MQGKIVTADDFHSSGKIRMIALRPTKPGEANLFKKLRESTIRDLHISFSDDSKELRIIIPPHVDNAPGVVPYGRPRVNHR